MMKRFLVAISIGFCVFSLAPKPAGAQVVPDLSTNDTSAVSTSNPTIVDKPVNTQRLEELQQLYQLQVEDYQNKYRQYTLAAGQWKSVQTLRSLEEALLAIRAAMTARDKVLITYAELQLETLQQTPGIEISLKDEATAALIARVNWLRSHQETVEQASDRAQLNAVADTFTAEQLKMQYELQRAMILVRVGQIQTTIDRADAVYERIKARNQANPSDARKQVERERAYVQVENQRALLTKTMLAVRAGLTTATVDRQKATLDYRGYADQLEQPYTQAVRYLAFLDELARDDW